MTEQPRFQSGHESEGKAAAMIGWALYILSIPSANVLMLVGVVVAYAARGSARGVAREHMDAQIRLFWSVIWWTVALWIGIFISIPFMVILVGFLTAALFGLLLLVLHIWFTVKSILGLLALAGDRAP